MFASDVSLPKDDKTAMRGKQITERQLTGLRTHRNANYATKERKGWIYHWVKDPSRTLKELSGI